MTKLSVILQTGARYMLPLVLLFSVFLLLRGHYLPGGGFIGGLAAAAGFALYALAYGIPNARALLRISPLSLIGGGLLVAIMSGLLSLGLGQPFMTGIWWELPLIGDIGTPVIFDVGVYMVVIGVVLQIIFILGDHSNDPNVEVGQA